MLVQVRVRADTNKGWGIAFKSFENELVIGDSSYSGYSMAINTCCPDPDGIEF